MRLRPMEEGVAHSASSRLGHSERLLTSSSAPPPVLMPSTSKNSQRTTHATVTNHQIHLHTSADNLQCRSRAVARSRPCPAPPPPRSIAVPRESAATASAQHGSRVSRAAACRRHPRTQGRRDGEGRCGRRREGMAIRRRPRSAVYDSLPPPPLLFFLPIPLRAARGGERDEVGLHAVRVGAASA